jgi:hypothetical protein
MRRAVRAVRRKTPNSMAISSALYARCPWRKLTLRSNLDSLVEIIVARLYIHHERRLEPFPCRLLCRIFGHLIVDGLFARRQGHHLIHQG